MDAYFLLLTFNVTVLARHEWIVWANQQCPNNFKKYILVYFH